MNSSRRSAIRALAALAILPCLPRVWAAETGVEVIRINIPGPHSLLFASIELIPTLGIDRALGVSLSIRYLPSGVRALEDVLAGNAHFAGVAFSVLPLFSAKGQDAVAVAPLSGKAPPIAIVIRKDLADSIKHVRDLKGRSIGVPTGSMTSKTYHQMVAEVLLSSYGVKPTEVRWVPSAQNFDGLHGVLAGKAVDAVFCEEPFVSELVGKGVGRVLVDMADPKVVEKVVGGRHLRAIVATSAELARLDPKRCEIMAKMMQRSFAWMASATPEKIISQLNVKDESERRSMISAITRAPDMFSSDGRFSRREVEATSVFLRAAQIPFPADFNIHSLVAYQWAGSKP